MIFNVLRDLAFLQRLFALDAEWALEVRGAGCPFCGGSLDDGSYLRKARGWLCDAPEWLFVRFSWCCRVEGCRKRVMPASVRFLGRKVYLSASIVLSEVFVHGITPRRVCALKKIFGVDRRTVSEWRRWWLESFRSSPFWRSRRGLLPPDLDEGDLPYSLWSSFVGSEREKLLCVLRFLRPLTVSGGYVSLWAPSVRKGRSWTGRSVLG